LNQLDLNLMKKEITFGANAIYLMRNKLDFLPTYYMVEDNLVAEDRADEINALEGPKKFFPLRLAFTLNRTSPKTIFFNHSPYRIILDKELRESIYYKFSQDISKNTCGGNTVTYTCMQFAYYMGITHLYLVGADHNYDIPYKYLHKYKNENYIIDSEFDDPNHFRPDYFGKGYRWHNPKVHLMEKSYKIAKKVFENDNRVIFNATKGGRLEVFKRVDYENLF
jgi:hypothetical protein